MGGCGLLRASFAARSTWRLPGTEGIEIDHGRDRSDDRASGIAHQPCFRSAQGSRAVGPFDEPDRIRRDFASQGQRKRSSLER